MQKNKINILLFLITAIFIFTGIFSLFYFAKAANLEVSYPVSKSGIALQSTNTPLPVLLKYIFDYGNFLGFMAVVYSLAYAGFLYLRAGAQPEALSQAKDRIWGAVSGILILLMTYLIITTINPQLAFFKEPGLQPIAPVAVDKSPGIYFFQSTDCSGQAYASTSNINDFGTDMGNRINSVLIVQSKDVSYISTLFSSPGLFGKCKYINPNISTCQQVPNIANSASIHRYNFNANNGSVTFYRKPFYNPEGGFIEFKAQDIKNPNTGFLQVKLEDLYFQNVPLQDQICTKWDENQNCIVKQNPSLAGKEISSIKIIGDFIVFFIYFAPNDPGSGPWTYCQEFPTPSDINKEGPKQFKWEKSTNQIKLPNWLFIIPVNN